MSAPDHDGSMNHGGAPAAPLVLTEVLERCMGNPVVVALLLEKFEAQLRGELDSMHGRVAAGDAGQIARAAHALKGAAGAMAAHGLRERAAEIETLAREARLDAVARELADLRAEVERCLGYLPAARRALAAEPDSPPPETGLRR